MAPEFLLYGFLPKPRAAAGVAGVALSALAAEVKEKLSTASYELKRNLLTLLIKRIEICLDEVRIVYKVSPQTLLSEAPVIELFPTLVVAPYGPAGWKPTVAKPTSI